MSRIGRSAWCAARWGADGNCFFQKHDSGGFPDAMHHVAIAEVVGRAGEQYFYVDDLPGIVAGGADGRRWSSTSGARASTRSRSRTASSSTSTPTSASTSRTCAAPPSTCATGLRRLASRHFPMLSGGKGFHVIAPLTRRAEWPRGEGLLQGLRGPARRGGAGPLRRQHGEGEAEGPHLRRLSRNERGSTAIAPYSTRARDGAPVAAPITWEEVETVKAANHFTVRSMPRADARRSAIHGPAISRCASRSRRLSCRR